jgi:hypothetical protein
MSMSFGFGFAPVYFTVPVTVAAVAGSTVKTGAADGVEAVVDAEGWLVSVRFD